MFQQSSQSLRVQLVMCALSLKVPIVVQSVREVHFQRLGRLNALFAKQGSTTTVSAKACVPFVVLGNIQILSGQVQAWRAFHVTEELIP